MDETDTFREIYSTREKVKTKFIKADKDLLEKKEKLFKQREIFKWGIPQDQMIKIEKVKEQLFNDKSKAF